MSPSKGSRARGESVDEREWVRKRRDEIRAELEDHLERRTRALEAQGRSPADAHSEAVRRMGDRERIEYDCLRIAQQRRVRQRRQWLLEDALRDVRFALRGFRRRPGLATGVVLTAALAIGAATSVFSVVNGVLLRPLPYPGSSQLYSVYTRYLPATGYDFPYFSLSGPEIQDYQAMTRVMAGVAAYTLSSANLAADGIEPERVAAVRAEWRLFDVLGAKPGLGRTFVEEDGAPGAPCVAVLSDGLWRERFGADTGIVHRDIRYDGQLCRVVGVMPAEFVFPDERFRVWTPFVLDPSSPFWERRSHPFAAVAKLRDGATLAMAEAELDGLRSQWSAEYPDHYALGHFIVLRSFRLDLVEDTRPALLVLLGSVGVVLLIVVVNVAGLILSSAESRRHELAMRAALGVERWRLLRLLLTEALVLGLFGGGLGIIASTWMLRAILASYPGTFPLSSGIMLDGRVLAFAVGLSILTGLLSGAVPAVQASRVKSSEALRSMGRGLTSHRGSVRARQGLVVAQCALALVLSLGAALLARSYGSLRAVDLGFDPEGVLTFTVAIPPGSHAEPETARAIFERLEERLAAIPGVDAAGAFSDLPLQSAGAMDDFTIEGRPQPGPGQQMWNAGYQMATPGALRALGLRLVEGRWFDENDLASAPLVAVINQSTKRQYFRGEPVLGLRLRYSDEPIRWITIVGVVADTRSAGVQSPPAPAIYAALAQAPRAAYEGRVMTFAVRFRDDLAGQVPLVRAAVAEVDPALPLFGLRTMATIRTEAVGQTRFALTLMTGFAGIALFLVALGVYGVLAHSVHLRSGEIGLRLTLGAERTEVLRMMLRQGMTLTAVGIALGFTVAVVLRRASAGFIFGVSLFDPASLLLAMGTLLAASCLACAVPAFRASRVDPVVTLRSSG
ncbi:MAG TPA: ABC transporter permease [Vicinamibacteria bacterium]|nr:ABC transporter permease [Vicinamibacteria bacterium]